MEHKTMVNVFGDAGPSKQRFVSGHSSLNVVVRALKMIPIAVSYTHLDVYKRQGHGNEIISVVEELREANIIVYIL